MTRFWYAKKMIHMIDPTIRVKRGLFLESLRDERPNGTIRKTIWISFHCDKIGITEFAKHLQARGSLETLNTLTYGILHEIGHFKTFSAEKDKKRDEINAMLKYLYLDGQIDKSTYQQAYMKLPAEREATEWAIDFSKRHTKFLLTMQKYIGEEKEI